jgi:tetratricopeptide (TPR) repeat protein
VKPTGDPDWFEHRAVVPLTGREPLLGQLRQRLANRELGWGWISLRGEAGAGITRLLQEAEALAIADGAALVLRVRPVGGRAVAPMEPLRRALAACFPRLASPQRLERALQACFPAGADEVSALAAWLVGGEGAVQMARPSPGHVRRFVEHFVRGGPVLVDDLDAMDEATREVLRPSLEGRGFGVVAGTHGGPDDALGEVWEVGALSRSQIDLMLRRWLKHPATAKRLTAVLLGPCQGLPGRVVNAVRSLGRDGFLGPSPRGIVLTTVPPAWPDGRADPSAFRRWAAQDATARRVLEVVGLLDGFEHTDLVAETAGVKPAIVEALRAEAVAARGGSTPGFFFAAPEERRAMAARIARPRALRIHERIAEAAQQVAARSGLALPLLHAALHRHQAGLAEGDEVAHALEKVLESAPAAYQVQPWVLDLLVQGVALVAGLVPVRHERVLARGIALIERAGRTEVAATLLRELAPRLEPTSASGLWMAARALDLLGRRGEAMDLFATRLPAVSTSEDAPAAFDAWVHLARWRYDAGDLEGARQAGASALKRLDPRDLHRRALWHGGMSAVARDRGRLRVAAAHGRRAVGLLRALGYLRPAGAALLRLGRIESERGREYEGLDCLARAAHLYHVVADAEGEAQARFAMGQTHAHCQAYEAAATHLECALEVVEREGLEALRVPLHLALARAHRGRGELARERKHAGQAVQHAAAALARLRAAAVLAEADLRSGAPGAEWLLERSERDLRGAGLTRDADVARALLAETRIRAKDLPGARRTLELADPTVPEARVTRARLLLAEGEERHGLALLGDLSGDATLPVDLRAAAHVHSAAGLLHAGRLAEARRAAIAGAALLEVMHRSRAHDARLHGILARVFARVGETGRAAGHRHLARRGMRRLVRAASDADEARRLIRMHWQGEGRPSLLVSA